MRGFAILGVILVVLFLGLISLGIWTLVVAGIASLLGFALSWGQCLGIALIVTVIQNIFSR